MADSWHIPKSQLLNMLDYNNCESVPSPCQMLVMMNKQDFLYLLSLLWNNKHQFPDI